MKGPGIPLTVLSPFYCLYFFDQTEGDLLVWGGASATANDFQINMADTPNAGVDGVSEALVDGAAEDHINLRMNGETFDLMG